MLNILATLGNANQNHKETVSHIHWDNYNKKDNISVDDDVKLEPLWWRRGKESTCQCKRRGFDPWVRTIPWSRK